MQLNHCISKPQSLSRRQSLLSLYQTLGQTDAIWTHTGPFSASMLSVVSLSPLSLLFLFRGLLRYSLLVLSLEVTATAQYSKGASRWVLAVVVVVGCCFIFTSLPPITNSPLSKQWHACAERKPASSAELQHDTNAEPKQGSVKMLAKEQQAVARTPTGNPPQVLS
jgi:hypothetical protein